MSFIAKKSGNSLPPVEAGIHKAVCQGVIDLGTQYSEKFEKSTHQLMIIFELPEHRKPVVGMDGKVRNLPRVVSKKFNLSLHDKSTLAKYLQSWRGKRFTPEEEQGFPLDTLLGENCMLQMMHAERDGRTYATISAVLPLMKGMEKAALEYPRQYFCFAEHGSAIPPDLPEWIVTLIKNSEEWQRFAQSGDGGDASFDVAELTK